MSGRVIEEETAIPPHIIICGVSDVKLSLAHPAFRGKGKFVLSHSSVSLPAPVPVTGVYF